jgi:hypothetical protein
VLANRFGTQPILTAPEKPSLIPCKGEWIHTVDGSDFDCSYKHSGEFGCEDCVVNGGHMDPRTGKRFARQRRKR